MRSAEAAGVEEDLPAPRRLLERMKGTRREINYTINWEFWELPCDTNTVTVTKSKVLDGTVSHPDLVKPPREDIQ